MRHFRYVGEATKTRGEYGVGVQGGHQDANDPEALAIFDPDFGDMIWSSIDAALASGDWVEEN